MKFDHQLLHPEKAREFLLFILMMAALVVGAIWVKDGARFAQLPEAAYAAAFVISLFAWWPAVYWLFPALTRLKENPSLTFRLAMRGALFIGFVVWSAGLFEANYFLRSGTHQ